MKSSTNKSNLRAVILLMGMVLFGIFVLAINTTLLVKGKKAVEEIDLQTIQDLSQKMSSDIHYNDDQLILKKPTEGEKIGQLMIPKLQIAIPIFHGTSEHELSNGIGHVIGTALPGENNNTILTGHRDTIFRRLGELDYGDILQVENSVGLFTYKVRKIRVVDREDQTVVVPKPKATLTLSTCYPFSYIGPAKQRYIIVADLVSSKFLNDR